MVGASLNSDKYVINLDWLHRGLLKAMKWHDPALVQRGHSYFDKVHSFELDDEFQLIHCQVQGSAIHPYLVEIYIPENEDEIAIADCSCPFSNHVDLRKHTYAAVWKLSELIQTGQAHFFKTSYTAIEKGTEPTKANSISAAWKWTDALAMFDSIAPVNDVVTLERRERLAWRIDYSFDKPEIECYKQTESRPGRWTRGRRVSLISIYDERANYANTEDAAVLACISTSKDTWWYREIEFDFIDALEALIGHPRVSWISRPNSPVTVKSGELTLGVEPTKGGFQLCAHLNGELCCFDSDEYYVTRTHVIRFDEVNDRIIVAKVHESLLGHSRLG